MITMLTRTRGVMPATYRLRILIVEDDPGSRWALGALLRRLGHECEVACDGREVRAKVEEFRPEAIVMDLMMPGVNGLEATRQLKADARTRDIPVLALTANATPSGASEARRAGCDDFLTKPVVLDVLLDRLQHHIGR